MNHYDEKITLATLPQRLSVTSVEESYERFRYDYAREASTNQQSMNRESDRDYFINMFSWRSEPTTEMIKRLFNQINTFYAERWMLSRLGDPPNAILAESNRLCLFRQGKHVGLRTNSISFGYRAYLDFMHPFRAYKWLYGIAPTLAKCAVDEWCNTIDKCPRTIDMAIVLAMTIIAIHPYSDANGRIGRLIFTWLCNRWRLTPLWLDEAGDGELRRTGHGIHSTEYLMAMFMLSLGGQSNVVDPGEGRQAAASEVKLFEALSRSLADMRTSDPPILATMEFKELKAHLWSEQHFRESSPRFECLRGALS
jgi:Fic/DOC family protein